MKSFNAITAPSLNLSISSALTHPFIFVVLLVVYLHPGLSISLSPALCLFRIDVSTYYLWRLVVWFINPTISELPTLAATPQMK